MKRFGANLRGSRKSKFVRARSFGAWVMIQALLFYPFISPFANAQSDSLRSVGLEESNQRGLLEKELRASSPRPLPSGPEEVAALDRLLKQGVPIEELRWLYGNKAVRLAEMMEEGLPVPPGVAIAGTVGDVDAILDAAAKIPDQNPNRWMLRSSPPVSMPGLLDSEEVVVSRAPLSEAIRDMRASWRKPAVQPLRRQEGPPGQEEMGLVLQVLKDGEENGRSGSGTFFTRDPMTGENKYVGRFAVQGSGKKVMNRSGSELWSMERALEEFPKLASLFQAAKEKLERRHKRIQEVEFVVESGRLWFVQDRDAEVSPQARARAAVEMAQEGILSPFEMLKEIEAAQEFQEEKKLFRIRDGVDLKEIARGIPSSAGAAHGPVVFSLQEAQRYRAEGHVPILIASDPTGEQVSAAILNHVGGILTRFGHPALHESVLASGQGVPLIDEVDESILNLSPGTLVLMDGTTGRIYQTGDSNPLEEWKTVSIVGGDFDYAVEAQRIREECAGKPFVWLQSTHAVLAAKLNGHRGRPVTRELLHSNVEAHVIHQLIQERQGHSVETAKETRALKELAIRWLQGQEPVSPDVSLNLVDIRKDIEDLASGKDYGALLRLHADFLRDAFLKEREWIWRPNNEADVFDLRHDDVQGFLAAFLRLKVFQDFLKAEGQKLGKSDQEIGMDVATSVEHLLLAARGLDDSYGEFIARYPFRVLQSLQKAGESGGDYVPRGTFVFHDHPLIGEVLPDQQILVFYNSGFWSIDQVHFGLGPVPEEIRREAQKQEDRYREQLGVIEKDSEKARSELQGFLAYLKAFRSDIQVHEVNLDRVSQGDFNQGHGSVWYGQRVVGVAFSKDRLGEVSRALKAWLKQELGILELPEGVQWRKVKSSEPLGAWSQPNLPDKRSFSSFLEQEVPSLLPAERRHLLMIYQEARTNFRHTNYGKRNWMPGNKIPPGRISVRQLAGEDGAVGVEISARDSGPGIIFRKERYGEEEKRDLSLAVKSGYTTDPGRGQGFPLILLFSDEALIHSVTGPPDGEKESEIWVKNGEDRGTEKEPAGHLIRRPAADDEGVGTVVVARLWSGASGLEEVPEESAGIVAVGGAAMAVPSGYQNFYAVAMGLDQARAILASNEAVSAGRLVVVAIGPEEAAAIQELGVPGMQIFKGWNYPSLEKAKEAATRFAQGALWNIEGLKSKVLEITATTLQGILAQLEEILPKPWQGAATEETAQKILNLNGLAQIGA